MGQQDLYQSDFYEDKGRFADVFNGVLFGGKEVMKPEELETEDSVIVGMPKRRNLKKRIYDKIRRWKGRYVSIMVLENQSYVGKEKLWDGSRSLYEMLEIDEEIKSFVNDFKLNLFDYHDYKDFSMFKTENRLLFEMLANAKDKKRMLGVLKRHNHLGEVDEVSARAILGVLNVKIDITKILKKDENGREVYDMCQAFEDYKEDGRKLGLKQGRREGKKEGKKEGELMMALKNVKNLMMKQQLPFEEAANILGITKRMQKELTTLI